MIRGVHAVPTTRTHMRPTFLKLAAFVLLAAPLSAQTADDVIAKYIAEQDTETDIRTFTAASSPTESQTLP